MLEKVKFSERYDTLATSHLAHVQATYDRGLHAKFIRRTSCRYKLNPTHSRFSWQLILYAAYLTLSTVRAIDRSYLNREQHVAYLVAECT